MRARRGERRAWLLVGAVVVVAVVLTVVFTRTTRSGEPLDPDNPDRGGAQALARVLASHGVDVEVARGAQELADARVDAATTVLVVQPANLGETTARQLLDKARGARLVAVEPGPTEARLLGVAADPIFADTPGTLAAGCGDPLVSDLEIAVDSAIAYLTAGCFRADHGAVLVRDGAVTVWGAADALTNDQILRADNAALALRLLGQSPRLVWYLPRLADVPADEGVSIASLIPRWVVPGLWLVLLTVLAVAWWRGRRLGPLAAEPLPVVVRAAETTEALGRLYRRSGDRAHAATALRRATLDRAAALLRLGSVPDQALVGAIAARTGRSAAEVAALLSEDTPNDDAALITLARSLAELEEEVRRP